MDRLRISLFLVPMIAALVALGVNLIALESFRDACMLQSFSNPLVSIATAALAVAITGALLEWVLDWRLFAAEMFCLSFFGSITIMLVANIFGYLGVAKLFFWITAVAMLIIFFFKKGGDRIASVPGPVPTPAPAAPVAPVAPAPVVATPTPNKRWWVWPIGFFVVLTILGTCSKMRTTAPPPEPQYEETEVPQPQPQPDNNSGNHVPNW